MTSHVVDSVAALKSAVFRAVPGETIVLKNGVYTTSGTVTIKCAGTAEKPITITAETEGGVELAGTHGFTVSEPAEHVIVRGFKFTHAAGKNVIGAGTRHVRFARNTFQCLGDGPYLSIYGDDVQIDYNDFADKSTPGSMIAVGGTGSQVARRLWIHHNYFHDLASAIASPAEMIRFGLTNVSLSTGNGIVEHNLFVRCKGESELISNRASGNTYRFNTFLESPTAQFSLRHGNDCAVYGNVFRQTEGLRVFGDRHQIFSNYFEGNYIGINIGNGSVANAEEGGSSGFDRPDDCVIAFNTFVENRTHYQMSRRTPTPLGAKNTTVANNVFLAGGVAARIEGPNEGGVWSGNLVWGKSGPGDMPAEGYTKVDPLFEPDANGIRRPQPDSPVIDSAVGNFERVTVDQDGQPRPELKDKGADEISSEPVSAMMPSVSSVGPGAQ